jgi:hypothetical protein
MQRLFIRSAPRQRRSHKERNALAKSAKNGKSHYGSGTAKTGFTQSRKGAKKETALMARNKRCRSLRLCNFATLRLCVSPSSEKPAGPGHNISYGCKQLEKSG